jgi:hypothetical protein
MSGYVPMQKGQATRLTGALGVQDYAREKP